MTIEQTPPASEWTRRSFADATEFATGHTPSQDPRAARDVAAMESALAAAEEMIANLRNGLKSSRQISAAVGIVMATRRLTYEDAFTFLIEISQRTNTKLRVVADRMIETGEVPTPPTDRAT